MTASVPTRGNDPSVISEVQQQYGAAPNAEELIAKHLESRDPELRQASLRPLDVEATEALDLRAVAGALDLASEEEVLAASVRGGRIIAVVSRADGPDRKVLVPAPGAE
jgi:hypothetical protein